VVLLAGRASLAANQPPNKVAHTQADLSRESVRNQGCSRCSTLYLNNLAGIGAHLEFGAIEAYGKIQFERRICMPRYRFAWSNFPPRLLSKLGTSLALDGEPADALRRRYGARPAAAFIQEAWPTLLGTWMPADSGSRQAVAEELRRRGLGKSDISPRGKQSQLDYLGSCRNSPTLRDVVLTAFLAAGETTQLKTPAPRQQPASMRQAPVTERPRSGPAEAPVAAPGPQDVPSNGDQPGSLNDWVEATLKDAYGLSEVRRDEDGDIPIPRGSAVLFIRRHNDESPFLEIFSPLVSGFRMSPEVYEAVNAINSQISMARASVVSDGTLIVLSAELLADGLSRRAFIFALDVLSDAADHFDTLLQKRFGGSTLLDDDDPEGVDV
jgi:Putative bacterial sensory transduction regulator